MGNHIRTVAAVLGALGVLGFLCAPLAGRSSEAGASVYMIEGKGEQWGLLLLALLGTLLVYLRRWGWAAGTAGALLLLALTTAYRSIQAAGPVSYIPAGRSNYEAPGFLPLLILILGVLLLLLAAVCGLAFSDSGMWQKEPTKPARSASAAPRVSWLETIDWGMWGVGLLSLLVWPLGLVLFFSYSRNGDEKANAALIGACIGIGFLLLRLLMTMVRVSSMGA